MIPAWAWVVWLSLLGGSFAVLEGIALRNRRTGDTLSENTRRWLGINPARPGRRASMAVFAGTLIAFTAWFVPHILFDWPF